MKRQHSTNITRFEDAKALRTMGLPLTLPVEHREFSLEAKRKLDAVMEATNTFGKAVVRWIKKQHDEKKYSAVCRAWDRLNHALAMPLDAKTLENTEVVAVDILNEPNAIVCSQWDELLTALENGEKRRIIYGEAPWPLGPFPAE